MVTYATRECTQLINNLINSSHYYENVTLYHDDLFDIEYYCETAEETLRLNDRYGQPMVWIGVYIAVASIVCIIAMAADLFHGFRNKKFWFPSKYFSLNAASITVIAVTMKLPVDLSSDMPRSEDQTAKLGSLAFMCMMMVNLMPSLASMDNMTLLANVKGLSILVITVIVNIIIQINTGAIFHLVLDVQSRYIYQFDSVTVVYFYVAMLILLLIIMISSSLTITTSKEILEVKYQATNKTLLTGQHNHLSKVEKLRQHVRRYWVMAQTGNPQFVMVSNPLSTASGGICVIVLLIYMLVVFQLVYGHHGILYTDTSVYEWSIIFILITQSIGVVVGTIAPVLRCFSVLSFKLVTKWERNHLMVCKIEEYWTRKLYEWKQTDIPFLSSSPRSRAFLFNTKSLIISICIMFQKVTVVLCKVIWLILIVVLRIVVYCWKSLKAMLLPSSLTASATDDIDEDLSNYVLQIQDEMQLAEKTLKGIKKSMNSFISKAEKDQSDNLQKLLEKSTGFEGVELFDTNDVKCLLPVKLANSWSLPVVNLTCIAVTIPNIHQDAVQNLLRSVGEGLSYAHLVEESLNTVSEYVDIRKATKSLWHEVEYNCRWLNNTLSKSAFEGKTAREILNWFSDKGEEIVTEIHKSSNGKMLQNSSSNKLIAANSMYRIEQTIILRDQSNTEPLSKKQLFALLNGMIADILSGCFTNLPRVITMKCHESVIEKREASVKGAARLLGKTTKIIERLEKRELPGMDLDKMAYIDEWRLYLKQSIP